MNTSNWFEWSDIQTRHYDLGASVVLGNQWGDEGKGKITDRLTQESDVIIRFQGGHNAGHTVTVEDKKFDLHILPSGMISEKKINIITSGCVLGIDLNKVDLNKITSTESGVVCKSTLQELLRRNNSGEVVRVGMIPELEAIQKNGVDIAKSGLKISGETMVIGMHNVLLDAFDEVCRKAAGLKQIGSTGSGISRAYSAEIQRLHLSVNDLLYHEDLFYTSIEALWESYRNVFINIAANDLIQRAKEEREKMVEYIKQGYIEIIGNERQYIKDLHKKGKKIVGEGAQSSMIGAGNSFFGTASDPSLQTFMNTTGLSARKVGNVFLVHKIPPTSVGERPGYLQYPDSPALNEFRDKYGEYGVSTGRPRDIWFHSLPETARGAWLNVRGIDDESKIVPVYNRLDGLEDMLSIDNGVLRVVTGFSYKAQCIVDGPKESIKAGVHNGEVVRPRTLLRNYPEKSAQATLFDVTSKDLKTVEIVGNVQEKADKLLGLMNAAIYKDTKNREFLVGTWPGRDDLELRKGRPIRRIK